ncbi:MAG TPA: hypothetical protein VGM23_08280, partial [Armatimonadota bacterium]
MLLLSVLCIATLMHGIWLTALLRNRQTHHVPLSFILLQGLILVWTLLAIVERLPFLPLQASQPVVYLFLCCIFAVGVSLVWTMGRISSTSRLVYWLTGIAALLGIYCFGFVLKSIQVHNEILPFAGTFFSNNLFRIRSLPTIWLALCTIFTLYLLVFQAKKSIGYPRLQLHYYLMGVSLFLAGILLDISYPPLYQASYIPCATLLGVWVFMGLTSYSCLRIRLYGISTVLRAGILHLFSIVVLTFLFGLLVANIDKFLWHHFHNIPYHAVSFFLALLLGMCFLPLLAGLKWVAEKALNRGPDIRQVIQDLSRVLAHNRDQQVLAQALTSVITRILHPRRLALYL